MWLTRWVQHAIFGAALLVLTLLSVPAPAASQDADGCDDGRAWTSDVSSGSTCNHVNLCAPEMIELTATIDLSWTWTFPSTCPMDAIDAVGVLVTSQTPFDDSTGIEGGTRPLVTSQGTADPARVGGGSLPITCGEVTVVFTIVSSDEVVATGQGESLTSPCPSIDLPDPPAFLGTYDESSGTAGAFARLYWAVFGRQPDDDGFGYWMARADAGLPLRSAAAIWTGLTEWTQAYDGTDNAEFLDRVYQNVLGRDPDQGGFDYWLGELDGGLAREELVVLFSDAPEFRQRTNTS